MEAIAENTTATKYINHNAAIERINADEKYMVDIVTNPEIISIDMNNVGHIVLYSGNDKDRGFLLDQNAFADLMTYTNIPIRYARDWKKEHPKEFTELLKARFYNTAHEKIHQRLFRVVKNNTLPPYIRAIMSDRYNIYLTNKRLLENTLKWAYNHNVAESNIKFEYKPYESLAVNIILAHRNINGEEIQFGFRTYNSEIGHGSMLVDLYIYILVCVNGAKRRKGIKSIRGVHIGEVLDNAIYTHQDRNYINPSITIENPLTPEALEDTADKIRALNDTKAISAPELETIEAVNKAYNLNTTRSQDTLIHKIFTNPNNYNYQRPMNAWGYYNAVTDVATKMQDEHGLTVRSENILNNPETWQGGVI